MRIEHFLEALQEHVGDSIPAGPLQAELESAICQNRQVTSLIDLLSEETLEDPELAAHIFSTVMLAAVGETKTAATVRLKEELRREGLRICSRAETVGGFSDQDRAELSSIYARAEGI